MLLAPTDLRHIHAGFGTPSSLTDRRRAVYSAVVELVGACRDGDATTDLLDSPATRAHLGQVIVDVRRYRPAALVPLSKLTDRAAVFTSGSASTFVVADPSARRALEPAVGYVESELRRQIADSGGIGVMFDDDDDFAEASRTVVEGLKTAVELCPELADDLLPHVALIAVVRHDGDEQLGSASIREYPGLVVVPRPASAIEVAEAFVHEGAHQKFFDLGITCSVFGDDFQEAPLFKSSWATSSASGWPLEQCAAAFHAYTCLATLHESVRNSGFAEGLHGFSLLPHAEARAAEIEEWVWTNRRFFGFDGRRFMAALAGRPQPSDASPSDLAVPHNDLPTVTRRCGPWTLQAQMGETINLYWLLTGTPLRPN